MHRVGSVPFINALPLVWPALAGDKRWDVHVDFRPPSQLPTLLADGEAEAILVSSVEALRMPGARVASGISISSLKRVTSVRLVSKVSVDKIQTLALDENSMTSNLLAQVMLLETAGIRPKAETRKADVKTMLAEFDACVLIGDVGMQDTPAPLRTIDLGAWWESAFKLPFVWALWVGREGMTPELANELQWAKAQGTEHIHEAAQLGADRTGLPLKRVTDYLTQYVNFDLSPDHLKGLALFGELLQKHNFEPLVTMPEIVEAGACCMA